MDTPAQNPSQRQRRIILVTGGARSGKSREAMRLAETVLGPRLFVATSPVTDPEMAERIARHRRQRAGRGWQTIEETTALAAILDSAGEYRVVLVDCLTLWINNLLWAAENNCESLDEDSVAERCRDLMAAARRLERVVLLVTNEVGLGIVPADPISRRYRDLVGRCNQEVAERADGVMLMTAGIAQWIKGNLNGSNQ